jgi:hypothetical protein
VRAGIRDQRGELRDVNRALIRDYSADADCDSTLTIDGAAAADLSSLGIVLADPPLRAPVLLQHSLRFALSARPQDRSNYFKSVLEIQDLETLRDLIEAGGVAVQTPPAAALSSLRGLRASGRLAHLAGDVEAADPSLVAEKLGAAMDALLHDFGVAPQPASGLAHRVNALRAALKTAREGSFPSSAYVASGDVPEAVELSDLSVTSAYNAAVVAVDVETARLTRIFEAVLAVPDVEDASTSVACPVCETPDALTPERVATIREQVEATAELRRAASAAHNELRSLSQQLQDLATSSRATVPEAAQMGADAVRDHEAIVGDLLGDAQLHRALIPLAADVASAAEALADAAGSASSLATAGVVAISEGTPVDSATIAARVNEMEPLQERLASACAAYKEVSTALLQPISEAIDRRQGNEDLRVLLELASDSDALRAGLLDDRARVRVRTELAGALKDVDKAKAKVFDEKFEAMSTEIDSWWQLLRPDEPVRFASVRRRGTGRRFVMFKAHLLGAPGVAAIERDALGVFSDSQLNALGLAAFLARACLQSAPLVVLDDPLQAGDEEHRATFVGYVIARLLELGIQLIVLTHDDMTSKLIHHRYEALPVDGFSISLDRPTDGSVVIRTTNTAEALLQRGKVYLESDDPEFRAAAAGHLRKAGERIAKEIIVNARISSSDQCSLADYEDQTLGPLIAELTPYLTKADHAGKWKVVGDLLNPGSHDDAPPAKQDLKMAFGYLREALREYLRPASQVESVPT